MRKPFLTFILALILITSLFALPLTALIFQESAKLAKEVAAWGEQCGDKPYYDESCLKKRRALSAELGQFVSLVNDELTTLRDISPNAPAEFVKESNGRRKIMELEVRNALHIIKCLGMASEPQCAAESVTIDEEKAALQAEYKQTHAVFDGTWISLRASVSPTPLPVGSQAPEETALTTAPSLTAVELLTLKDEHSDNVKSVAFSPDGKRIVTGGDDATAKVWDAQSGKELRTLKGHSDTVDSVAVSRDGRRIATCSLDATKVWDAQSGKELLTLEDGGTSVAFSPDSRRIVTGGYDHTAKVWDAQSGKELLTLKGHSDSVKSVAFSPDGRRIATCSADDGGADATAKVWDAQSGKELFTLKGHSYSVNSVAFSLDGKRIVTGSSDATAKVWDAQSGKELLTLSVGAQVDSVAFSPDGRRIATCGIEATKVWDGQSGKELLTLEGLMGYSVAFSPDGKRVVTGSADHTVKIWELGDRVAKPATPNIASIAKEQPYENSLGMKFVPVPETSVLLSIWDTRVQDYEVFAKETRREVVKPSFQQSDVDPVVNVSWNDAKAFCDWLTAKEHKERRLAANQRYRLPTNMEWDCAVGLNCEEDRHPYAWGDEWPPPKNNGNYSPQLAVDPYEYTSPVGAFAANKYGLYDIGGNVLQWCDDWTDNSQKAHLQRGSSWASATRATIQLDAHSAGALNDRRPTLGFRCVTTSLTRNGRTWQTWLGEFVRQFVAANQMQDVDATLASYGSVVDYFDNGQKDQGYIRADIERYIERWPTRHDSIENSNIRFEEKSPDKEYVANFKLDFYAESSARRAWSKGQFDIILNIMISDGVPKIVQIKEKVTRQQRGNLSGPLTATPGPSASQRLKGRNR
jgi:WD40 repeat protein